MAHLPTLDLPRDVIAVTDLSASLLGAAAKVMEPYPANPRSTAILAAGFARAIDKITDDVHPGFRSAVRDLLREGRE